MTTTTPTSAMDAWAGVRAAVVDLVTSTDVAGLPAAMAAGVLRDVSAVRKSIAALESLLVAHVAAAPRASMSDLAAATGESIGQTRRAAQLGAALGDHPEVASAALAGALSAPQAEAVTRAAAADPGSTGRLLEVARTASLGELRDECTRVVRAADPDPAATRARLHARREVRSWTDTDGMGVVQLRHLPDVIARCVAAIHAARQAHYDTARRAGTHEPTTAYDADATVDLLTGSADDPAAARPRVTTKVIVRVDHAALVRGRLGDGEICDIPGVGPIDVHAARELLAGGDCFVAAVLTKGVEVTKVVHLGRRATATQTTALEWLHPTCAVEGCAITTGLQIDHRDDWAATKRTQLDKLDRFCGPHHRKKTIDNWQLVEGRGIRPFVGPDDPRHPRHHRRRAS